MLLKPLKFNFPNKGHRLSRGLIGYWLFNEGSGKIVHDLSGNGYQGIVNGNARFVPSIYGPGIEFGGVGDYIDLQTPLIPADDFSLTWFCRPDDVLANYPVCQYITGAAGRFSPGFENGFTYVRHGAAQDYGSAVIAGQLYHIGITRDRSTGIIKLYINGKIDPLFSITTATDPTTMLVNTYIGRLMVGNDYDGIIDFVNIWNRVLSAQEIEINYRRSFCLIDQGEIEYGT